MLEHLQMANPTGPTEHQEKNVLLKCTKHRNNPERFITVKELARMNLVNFLLQERLNYQHKNLKLLKIISYQGQQAPHRLVQVVVAVFVKRNDHIHHQMYQNHHQKFAKYQRNHQQLLLKQQLTRRKRRIQMVDLRHQNQHRMLLLLLLLLIQQQQQQQKLQYLKRKKVMKKKMAIVRKKKRNQMIKMPKLPRKKKVMM